MTDTLIPPTPSTQAYEATDAAKPITALDSPFALFAEWLTMAREHEPNDPNAMCLATTDADGLPDARMVLLKECDDPFLGFYTNFDSEKGQQLAANPKAALVFHWKSMRRQIRVRGPISQNTQEAADAYYASRSRFSQIGAIASKQSRPLDSRDTLTAEADDAETRYEGQMVIPRPANWGGYLLRPTRFEFWQDQPYRLHDRVQYSWDIDTAQWGWQRLYP